MYSLFSTTAIHFVYIDAVGEASLNKTVYIVKCHSVCYIQISSARSSLLMVTKNKLK